MERAQRPTEAAYRAAAAGGVQNMVASESKPASSPRAPAQRLMRSRRSPLSMQQCSSDRGSSVIRRQAEWRSSPLKPVKHCMACFFRTLPFFPSQRASRSAP